MTSDNRHPRRLAEEGDTAARGRQREGTGTLIWWISALAIGMISLLILLFSPKVSEPYTELYFADYSSLPHSAQGTLTVSYVIWNKEGADRDYTVRVWGARPDEENRTSDVFYDDSDRISIAAGQSVTVRNAIPLPDYFDSARIQIETDDPKLSIHFWVENEGNIYRYESGNGSVRCFGPPIVTGPLDKVTFNVSATEGNGWPDLLLFIDGELFSNLTINWTDNRTIRFETNAGEGMHILDFASWSDYYNSTRLANGTVSVIDRNLFVNNVTIAGVQIDLRAAVLDNGKGMQSFDCLNTKAYRNGLYSPGALRLRINSTTLRGAEARYGI